MVIHEVKNTELCMVGNIWVVRRIIIIWDWMVKGTCFLRFEEIKNQINLLYLKVWYLNIWRRLIIQMGLKKYFRN